VSFPFHSILVPMDFDESAKAALDLAKEIAAAGDATIHLMHVMTILLVPGEAANVVVAREDEVRAALDKIAGEKLNGVRHQLHVRTGDTARAVVDTARELNIDLIVMPTHGRHGLPRFFLGSVAERVVREAPCPVLTVRPSTVHNESAAVGAVMLKNPPSVTPDQTLAQAQQVMQREDLLSVPVVANGAVAGIITDRDIRAHLGDLEKIQVASAMAIGPVTVAPSMPVHEAAQLLVKLGVGALPVVENGRLIGMLSTREVIVSLLEHPAA
jgi:universal stress protein A